MKAVARQGGSMLFERLGTSWAQIHASMREDMRILVVDDEEMIGRVLSRLLEREGLKVDAVKSVPEAWTRLDKQAYDLLIADKNLPGQSGLDLISEIQQRGMDLPTIMISGNPSAESIVQALQSGAVDYIEKPFPSFQQLVKRLTSIVQQRTCERFYSRVLHDLGQVLGGEHADQVVLRDISRDLSLFKQMLAERQDIALIAEDSAPNQVVEDALLAADLKVRRYHNFDKIEASLRDLKAPLTLVVDAQTNNIIEFLPKVKTFSPFAEALVFNNSLVGMRQALQALEAGAFDLLDRPREGLDMLQKRSVRMAQQVRRRHLYGQLLSTLMHYAELSQHAIPMDLISALPKAQQQYVATIGPALLQKIHQGRAGAASSKASIEPLKDIFEEAVQRSSPRVNARVALRAKATHLPQSARSLTTLNLSEQGMFVCTDAELPIGSRLQIEVNDPDSFTDRGIPVMGEVVRRIQIKPDPRGLSGIGLRVLNADHAYQRVVTELLQQYGPAPVVPQNLRSSAR